MTEEDKTSQKPEASEEKKEGSEGTKEGETTHPERKSGDAGEPSPAEKEGEAGTDHPPDEGESPESQEKAPGDDENALRNSASSAQNFDPENEANILETLETKNIERANSATLKFLEKKGAIAYGKLIGSVASKVLTAIISMKDPKKRKREYLIPKDKAAWLEWMVQVAKKRINVEYLTDKELRKVIIRARPNLSPYKPKFPGAIEDPHLPPCIAWTEEQVGNWIESIGWPTLRDTFIRNKITGRRLVLVDCSALNKMGMTDLAAMKDVAGKIRELLGIPPPNALRPIMRVPPFERFLRRKVYNGRSYDELTFEKFCEQEGYNYELVSANKNAQIPCTTEVLITTPENAEIEEGEGEESDEEHSLKNAPTVEFLVRNALVRNKTVDQLMEDILENVFLPPRERKYGKEVWGSLKRGIGEGFDDLYLYYPKQRLEFAAGVAHSLVDELYKTVAILNDINQLEKHIKENVTEEDMEMFRSCAQTLIEEAVPIAALLALGELDLESIFRQQPEFEKFVDEIVRTAESKTNELVPDASSFVDEIIKAALKKVPSLDLKELKPETRESLLKMTTGMLEKVHRKKSRATVADVNLRKTQSRGAALKIAATRRASVAAQKMIASRKSIAGKSSEK